jgi:Terminase small subunit
MEINIEELRKDHLYARLTDKQKGFLEAYIRLNGDHVAAAKEAYECKDEHSARAYGYQMVRHSEISALIDRFYGSTEPSKDEFLRRLWKMIVENTDKRGLKDLMTLYARLKGWDKQGREPEQPSDSALQELLSQSTT